MESDFVVIENATWCPGINSVMETFRQDGMFCNVTLRSCDDQEFHAHALVLAASSRDMQTLLLTQMDTECVLEIERVGGKTIEHMLQFIYSGRVFVPVGELSALATLSEQLGIEQLNDLCCNIKTELQSHLDELLTPGDVSDEAPPYSLDDADDNDEAAVYNGDTSVGALSDGADTNFDVASDSADIEQSEKESSAEAEQRYVFVSAEDVEISQADVLLTTMKMDREVSVQQLQDSFVETDSATLETVTDGTVTHSACTTFIETLSGELMVTGEVEMVDGEVAETVDDTALTQISDGEQTQADEQVKVECLQAAQDARPMVYVTLTSNNEEETVTEADVKLEVVASMPIYASTTVTATDAKRTAGVFSCPECKKTFKKRSYLDNHMRCHSGQHYECLVCGKMFQWQRGLQLHTRIHTGEKPYRCETCGQRFAHSSNYLAHTRRHLDVTPFACATCGQKFGSKSSMIRHRRKHDEDRLVFECEFCKKQFSERHLLVKHERIHTGDAPYTCDVCHRSFVHTSSLAYHKWTHRTDRPVKCSVCGTGCISNTHLAAHMRMHTGEKPFACRLCTKSFAVQANLISHTRIHTGERPYKCLLCGKSFVTSSNLHRHQQWHANQVPQESYSADQHPFQCSVCGKRFAKRNCMRQHEKYHENGNARFQCPDCDANFSRPSNLKRHMRQNLHGDAVGQDPICVESTTIKEENKFECATCSKRFSRILHLKRHEDMHKRNEFMYSADGRPFECDVCKKCFKSKGTLGQHLLTHKAVTERKRLFCTFCSKGFIRQNHLSNHVRTAHAEESLKTEDLTE